MVAKRAIGPDISFYQDDNNTPQGIDFDEMKLKADWVNIRAGQNTWIDSDFATNWIAAKKAGLMRGSYWYYDSRSEPESQARLWAEALGDDLGELPLCVDIEEAYGGRYAGWRKWMSFIKYVQKYIPNKKIMIYTGFYYWGANAPNPDVYPVESEFFGQFPLWLAWYTENIDFVQVPYPWDHITLWQYTSVGDGPSYGVESLGIDLNELLDDEVWFFGEEPPVEPPPEPPAEETTVIITYQSDNPVNFIFVDANVAPPAPTPVEMQLVRKEEKTFCVIHRAPIGGEIHKLHLDFIEGATVKVLPVPKNRIMMREDGTTHEVPNWETEADFHKLNAVWAFLPIQEVQKSNLNFRMLHNDWTDSGTKGNWDTKGSYIKRIYLKEIAPPELPAFEFRVPDIGEFVYVNHDWGSQYWEYQPRSSPDNPSPDTRKNNGDLPDTGKGMVDRFNPMPKDWQLLWRDVARYYAPDMHDAYDVTDFLSFPVAIESLMADTRAITDNHAAENGFINYVTGENLDDPLGKGVLQVKEMFFGGNIGKVLEGLEGTYILEAFDMSKPAPTLEEVLRDYSHLIGWCTTTQCYRIDDKWDGIESAKPFPQIRDAANKRTGTPYLVTGLGGRIEMRKTSTTRKCLDLSTISSGEEYSPYKYRTL